MYQYPYGNAQQLNLDWILGKIQELEAHSDSGDADLEEVANALVSASFDSGVSYRRYDYCFYNGKLYRALTDNVGAFDPDDWLEVVIGDDIPVLTRLLNAVDTSLTSLQTTVGNQGNDITTLQNAVSDLDSDDVDNASLVVSGDTVTDALNTLNGAINHTTFVVTGITLTNKTAEVFCTSNTDDRITEDTNIASVLLQDTAIDAGGYITATPNANHTITLIGSTNALSTKAIIECYN